jgi:CHAT domain-containing protein
MAQVLLDREHPQIVQLAGAESATFIVESAVGNFVRIAATTPDSAVELNISENGTAIVTTTSLGGSGGVAEAAAISTSKLGVRVQLSRKEAATRPVTVSILARRPASDADRADAAGFRLFSRALDPKATATALAALDEAGLRAVEAGDDWLRFAISVSRAVAHLRSGKFEDAAAAASRALSEHASALPLRVKADLVYLEAVSRLQHEESSAAVPLFERAAELQRTTGQKYELAYSLHNLSVARWLLGDCATALTEAHQALDLRRDLRDQRREAYTLMAVAKDHLCLGDAQHALDTYSQVAPLWQELKDEANQAAVLNDRGLIFSYLGEWAQSDTAHQEALAIRTRLNDKAGLVESLTNLGLLQVAVGRYREAVSNCERALGIAREIHYRRGEGYVLLNLAQALSGTGGRTQARAMLRDAVHIFSDEHHRPGEAWGWQLLSKIDRLDGDLNATATDLDTALALSHEIGDRILESITLVDLARLYRDRREDKQALVYTDQAIARIEHSRASLLSPDLRAAWLSSKRDVYGLRIALSRDAEEAFMASEQAHARVLLDAIAESHGDVRRGIDPKMLTALHQVDAEIDARATMLARSSHSKSAAEEQRRELDRSLARKVDLENRVRLNNPRYAALVLPSPAPVDEIRRHALDDDTALLEYYVGENRSYVWLLTRDRLEKAELPGRAALEQQVRKLYSALTERNNHPPRETAPVRQARLQHAEFDVTRISRALATTLLPSLTARRHYSRVLVVRDGPLYLIPFALLLSGTPQPEIVYLPSASVLLATRREQQSPSKESLPALVIADPVFSSYDERVKAGKNTPLASDGPELLNRLEWSRSEARKVAALAPGGKVEVLLDFAANVDALRNAGLARYRVIHIASHALLDDERPALSGIVFSTVDEKGKPRESQLRLHEIYNLDLQARLVVLSACRTALGKEVRGEGMMGLSRGFMYAGAQSVLATLWSVDDYATAQFMSEFYRELWKAGRTPASALQVAQAAMKKQPRFRSPYYWAGYTLTGEWR